MIIQPRLWNANGEELTGAISDEVLEACDRKTQEDFAENPDFETDRIFGLVWAYLDENNTWRLAPKDKYAVEVWFG